VEDAVARFCAATEAGDMAGLASTLAPGVELPSPLIGRAVFKGRDDVLALLASVYGMLREVRWEQPIGDASRQVAIAEARVAGLRIGDAMGFELDGDGLISRVRPHLRPLLASTVFFLMIGPRVARRPAILLRALRA
jgi:SnoaL-like domain